MTVDEIGAKLMSRYNWTDKSGLMTDIKNELGKYNAIDLDRIWFKFDTTYVAAWPPKPAHFYKIAEDLGLAKNGAQGKFHGAYECADCGAKYSMESSNCPMCKSADQKRIVDAASPGIIACQHDCYHCDIYADPNGFDRYGPACKSFSLGREIPNCSTCRCRDCCEYEHAFREDERNNTFFTEGRPMPWIGEAGKGVTQRVTYESLMTAVRASAARQREADKESIGYKRGWLQKYKPMREKS